MAYRNDELPAWVYAIIYIVVVWGILNTIGVFFYYGDLLWTTYTLESLPWSYWFNYWSATIMVTVPVAVIIAMLSFMLYYAAGGR